MGIVKIQFRNTNKNLNINFQINFALNRLKFSYFILLIEFVLKNFAIEEA